MGQFSAIAGMPGVIVCVDGTDISVRGTGGADAELYRCRKGFYFLNIHGVYDAQLKYTNIVLSWPDNAHDSRMFANSLVCQHLQRGQYRGFLLGDNGYPCCKYILTLFLVLRTEAERKYIQHTLRQEFT